MPSSRRRFPPASVAVLAASFSGALVAAFFTTFLVATLVGLGVLVGGLALLRAWRPREVDPGRRDVLTALGLAGVGVALGGSGIGRAALRLVEPDPDEILREHARSLGSKALESIRRGVFPGRSGDLQLILAPWNTSNYPHESKSLEPRDPRSSHALVWPYTDRVPIVVYGPGIVEPGDGTEEVTLADLAPTTARLIGSSFEAPDGEPLPGLSTTGTRPKVVVTFVIDGGGWNALTEWPDAWPTIKRLARGGMTYRNGFMGSFPNVTASAHATIGTGAFPRTHGISGHHIRLDGRVTKALGLPGEADPSTILVPTLADVWDEETRGRAWIGEIGYQVWHLGMIGRGGRPMGRVPVGVYWDEVADDWAPHNPDAYRFPGAVPPRSALARRLADYLGSDRAAAVLAEGGKALCCDPPIVHHQGDLLAATFETEPIGEEETGLLYINYKAPDYAGHVYNMLAVEERAVIEAVDRDLGRLVDILERRFPGEYVLIVTADHGQCPLIEEAGGVRLDPIQLTGDIESGFGDRPLVQSIRPSEVYLDGTAMADAGVGAKDVAAFLDGYRYGENVGPYVPDRAIEQSLLRHREFAAVLPVPFVEGLTDGRVRAAGAGAYEGADPGVAPVRW